MSPMYCAEHGLKTKKLTEINNYLNKVYFNILYTLVQREYFHPSMHVIKKIKQQNVKHKG